MPESDQPMLVEPGGVLDDIYSAMGYPDGVQHPPAVRPPAQLPAVARSHYSVMNMTEGLVRFLGLLGGVGYRVRYGRIPKNKRIRGFFQPHGEFIRQTKRDDIETTIHEIGHAVEKLLFSSFFTQDRWGEMEEGKPQLTSIIKQELHDLGKALYGDRTPNGGYKAEGWAEYFFYLVTNRGQAQALAPSLHQWFRNWLEQMPGGKKVWFGIRDLQGAYRALRKLGDVHSQA